MELWLGNRARGRQPAACRGGNNAISDKDRMPGRG